MNNILGHLASSSRFLEAHYGDKHALTRHQTAMKPASMHASTIGHLLLSVENLCGQSW